MSSGDHYELELDQLHCSTKEDEQATDAGTFDEDGSETENPMTSYDGIEHILDSELDRRTKRKLDWVLLPFVAVLYLLDIFDKWNIGYAEAAGFTRDAGLERNDLNTAMALFFAFFVALQPVGATFGRRYGMSRWVPACMGLWGVCTLLHVWVRRRWQLVLLRVAIASLQAGFYPTTVSFLSLFYTRYEFATRLGFIYGQTVVAGVINGFWIWATRSDNTAAAPENFPLGSGSQAGASWRKWEVVFLIESCTTIMIAVIGFFWLPRSAGTAWFFDMQERQWAEERVRLDLDNATRTILAPSMSQKQTRDSEDQAEDYHLWIDEDADGEEHNRLLGEADQVQRSSASTVSDIPVTANAGLTKKDVLSAVFNYRIWHILVCNILSGIPATTYGVFLPLVAPQLSTSLDLSPATSHLLSVPPFICGGTALFAFARWSDRSKRRIGPILYGLSILLVGLITTATIPASRYILRYISLCFLMSGSFIVSPLMVAWIANNTPEPGKRAVLLGISGWGNLASILLTVVFTPQDRERGYIIALLCGLASFAGYVGISLFAGPRRKNIKSS